MPPMTVTILRMRRNGDRLASSIEEAYRAHRLLKVRE